MSDVWISKSNPGKQVMLSVVSAIVGLVLVIGFHDFSGLNTNDMAGFFLGVLLLLIGVAGTLVSGKQTIIIDPKAHRITIEDLGWFRTKKRIIPFKDIVGVSIGYLGKKSNYVTCYYLALSLTSGEMYPLFSPGRYFEGGSDRSIVESWKQRLEDFLSQ